MKQDMLNYINNQVMREAGKLIYSVKDLAPSNETDLFNSTSLVIWSGASETTIFKDKAVNWAFRALHDSLHLKTGIGFSPKEEITIGKLQASKYDGLMAELVYCETSLQAQYYLTNGKFVENQIEFTLNYLKTKGLIK